MTNKNIIPIAVIAAGLIVGGALIYTQVAKCEVEQSEDNVVSPEQASSAIIDFINRNILGGQAEASLTEVLEEKGLYKMKLSIGGQEITSYATRDGKLFFPDVIDLENTPLAAKASGATIGQFSVSDEEICAENGAPLVYFFGSDGCSHCQWEHPIIKEVAEKFGEEISFRDNMNDQKADAEIFQKYSSGGVPTVVIGCKYYRVGSGENAGEEQEKNNLTALFCSLTDNNPTNVCDQVKDLVGQI